MIKIKKAVRNQTGIRWGFHVKKRGLGSIIIGPVFIVTQGE